MSKIDPKIFTLNPTSHMRFVLRDVTALNPAVNNYELTSVKILLKQAPQQPAPLAPF